MPEVSRLGRFSVLHFSNAIRCACGGAPTRRLTRLMPMPLDTMVFTPPSVHSPLIQAWLNLSLIHIYRFDSSRWSVLFGGLAGGLVTMLAQVALRIFGDTSWVGDGLIPVGVSANPHSPLRELDALWRPGPQEIMLYVCLLYTSSCV